MNTIKLYYDDPCMRAFDAVVTDCVPEGKRYRRPLVLTQKGAAAGAEVSRRIDSIVALASCDVLEEDRLAMYRALSIISKNLEKIYQNKEKQL